MFDNILAKEGHSKIIVAFIAFLFFVIIECGFLALVSFAIFLILIYIFRYKYIDFNSFDENKIYAPISGKVSAIDVKDFNKTIHIDVALTDSHILRNLENGEIKLSFQRGLNLFLGSFKSKKLNENATLTYKNSKMRLYSSLCNSSIELEKVNELKKGEKIGVFLHGQVIIDFDDSYTLDVNIGQEIKSGETIIASKKTT